MGIVAAKVIPTILCGIAGMKIGGNVGLLFAENEKPGTDQIIGKIHQLEITWMASKISEIAYQKLPQINQQIFDIKNSVSPNPDQLLSLKIEKKQLNAISHVFLEAVNIANQLASQAILSSLKI